MILLILFLKQFCNTGIISFLSIFHNCLKPPWCELFYMEIFMIIGLIYLMIVKLFRLPIEVLIELFWARWIFLGISTDKYENFNEIYSYLQYFIIRVISTGPIVIASLSFLILSIRALKNLCLVLLEMKMNV